MWHLSNDDIISEIQHFNIYRSNEAHKDFEKINAEPLRKDIFEFREKQAPSLTYYQVEAIDNHDRSYLSNVALFQAPDSIPPAIPTGLSGKFLNSKKIELYWEPNAEEDLKGYRLFASNKDESVYTQITKVAIKKETFVYEINDPKFIVDSIYFKIISTDFHDNYSERSTSFALARPDVVPPSKPSFYKATPTPAGIEIGFRFSATPDVNYHELQRKKTGAPGWEAVLNIPVAEQINYTTDLSPNSPTTTCYIDSTLLESIKYDYRFVAYDHSQNVSSSQIISVRPFDSGVRGEIASFVADVSLIPHTTLTNEGGYDVITEVLETYDNTGQMDPAIDLPKLVMWNVITQEEMNTHLNMSFFEINLFLFQKRLDIWQDEVYAIAELTWSYDNLNNLQDFQIYRAANGSVMMLYKTLPLESLDTFSFKDYTVKPSARYFYQIVARHKYGGHSKLSPTLTVKIPNSDEQ